MRVKHSTSLESSFIIMNAMQSKSSQKFAAPKKRESHYCLAEIDLCFVVDSIDEN